MSKRWLMVGIGGSFLASALLATAAEQTGQALRFSVSASVEASDNRDAAETDEVSNEDFYLRPRIELGMGSDTSFLSGYYEPSFRYRTEPGDDQNEFEVLHRLELAMRHAFSERARLRITEHFRKIEDPQVQEGGSILRADRSYFLNEVRVGLNYDLGRLSNIDLLAHNRIRRYDEDDVAALSDKDESGVAVAFRHTLAPKLQGLLRGAYRMYGYEEDDTLFSRDFDTVIGSVGAEYLFTPQVIGTLAVGMQSRMYDQDELDSDDNAHVRGELSGELSPELRVGMSAGFGVRDADVFPYPSQEYTEVRGFSEMNLTSLLRWKLAATYRTSTYDPYPELGLAGGDEDIMVLDTQLSYQFSDPASFMVGYRIEDVSADDTLSGSFTRNTARAGIQASF